MVNKHLTELFKTEYRNLVAVLCHYYGIADVQLAEDIVSDSFIKAMRTWSHNGIPKNPKAWLRKTAQNQLKDHFRRKKNFEEKVKLNLNTDSIEKETITITDEIIKDSQLKMIFAVCNPKLSQKAQICMALRILCGFNISEVANAMLSNQESVNKTLYRAKKTLRKEKEIRTHLTKEDYIERLDNVLRIIYLLFNEGYYSSTNEENIQEEICWEAMRLVIFLSNQRDFPLQNIHALLALMCFHASRIEARKVGERGDLLYDEQDKTKWNHALIQKGEKYLHLSAKGTVISKYHIEASIAYWHTTENDVKWEHILQLYNRLLTIEYSPTIAMNRTYALAKANSIKEAIDEALKLNLTDNHHYLCLMAELYKMDNQIKKEKDYLHQAFQLAEKENEKKLIQQKIESANLNN